MFFSVLEYSSPWKIPGTIRIRALASDVLLYLDLSLSLISSLLVLSTEGGLYQASILFIFVNILFCPYKKDIEKLSNGSLVIHPAELIGLRVIDQRVG